MNTKISILRSDKYKDDIVVLSDKNNLSWTSSLLSKDETTYLKSAAKKEINSVFIPNLEKNIIVQFIKTGQVNSLHREDVRVAGNEILTTLSHYKIEKTVLLDRTKKGNLLEFVEGMTLGNYQFLKYFNEKKEKENQLKEIKLEKGALSPSALNEIQAILEGT